MLKLGLIAGYHCIKLTLNSGVFTGWQKDCFKRNHKKLLLLNHAMKLMLICGLNILGNPGAASRDDGIFMGESLQQERESPWALTLTERVPEAFEIPPSDWPENFFSGQSAKRNSWATLMSSYTRLFSSSIAVVAWPVQREHFWGELQKKKYK